MRIQANAFSGTDRSVISLWLLHTDRSPFFFVAGQINAFSQSGGITLVFRILRNDARSSSEVSNSGDIPQQPTAFPIFKELTARRLSKSGGLSHSTNYGEDC